MEVSIQSTDVRKFAQAFGLVGAEQMKKTVRGIFAKIGAADIKSMREQISRNFKVKTKKFINSFVWQASAPDAVANMSQMVLREYTGAKLFQIFETGGEVGPRSGKYLMILTDAGKRIGYLRVRSMLRDKRAEMIVTPKGPLIIMHTIQYQGRGKNKSEGEADMVLAVLRPKIEQKKRVDFFGNFERNAGLHQQIVDQQAQKGIDRTLAQLMSKL
jgi:hypothetical protein